ncbi:MAG: hypothetical protein ACI8TQ_002271 [Planctomycetota bacterium]|jgi:hypothetical protein
MSNPKEVGTAQQDTRLAELWLRIEKDPAYSHASIVIPSLSMDAEELKKIAGVAFYEERLLFLLMRLRNPAARVLYITSQPIPVEVIDYYLELLGGVPASHARERLKMLCVYDSRPLALTAKILERPRVVARMRQWIGNRNRAYMTCFNSSGLESTLAEQLGVPLNGVDPELLDLGTKSGSRKIFKRAGVACPDGFEDVRSRSDIVDRLLDLESVEPRIKRAVVKLDTSFAGEGNACFTYPEERRSRAALEDALDRMTWNSATEHPQNYFSKLNERGGIVERLIEATEVRSPSAQMRITPTGEIQHVSTHEQILGGAANQAYMGCRFPADDFYRERLQSDAYKIAEVLRDEGVVSRFAVDFVAWQTIDSNAWQTAAIEINLRMGGTTFPFLALEFLTHGKLDSNGHFISARGNRKFYVATDTLKSPSYVGLLPEDLTDIMIAQGLNFDPGPETGVLFHMIGALSQYGKLGVIAIGDSLEQAQQHYDRTRDVLDQETSGRKFSRQPGRELLPMATRRID